jgi:uncharacterized metal-binding protein YceD (DUF177 family)
MQHSNNDALRHPVRIDELSSEAMAVTLEADEQQRQIIASHVEAEDVAAFKAELRLRKSGSTVTAEGTITGDLGRTCVVSLEPMREKIDENFASIYTTEVPEETEGELEADLDAPEPIEGDTLNLWDVALEQLVLSMNAHPRKEGAKPPEDPGAGAKISPFDVLKGLQS